MGAAIMRGIDAMGRRVSDAVINILLDPDVNKTAKTLRGDTTALWVVLGVALVGTVLVVLILNYWCGGEEFDEEGRPLYDPRLDVPDDVSRGGGDDDGRAAAARVTYGHGADDAAARGRRAGDVRQKHARITAAAGALRHRGAPRQDDG